MKSPIGTLPRDLMIFSHSKVDDSTDLKGRDAIEHPKLDMACVNWKLDYAYLLVNFYNFKPFCSFFDFKIQQPSLSVRECENECGLPRDRRVLQWFNSHTCDRNNSMFRGKLRATVCILVDRKLNPQCIAELQNVISQHSTVIVYGTYLRCRPSVRSYIRYNNQLRVYGYPVFGPPATQHSTGGYIPVFGYKCQIAITVIKKLSRENPHFFRYGLSAP